MTQRRITKNGPRRPRLTVGDGFRIGIGIAFWHVVFGLSLWLIFYLVVLPALNR